MRTPDVEDYSLVHEGFFRLFSGLYRVKGLRGRGSRKVQSRPPQVATGGRDESQTPSSGP